MRMHNTVVRRKAIDTASLRIKYAWGATDITQDSTYLDCGQLLIGQRMTKYSSWFVEVADSQRVQWAKMNPHAQSVPNGTWWMRGKKPGVWSEYQYSNIFIHGDTLNEWAVMPMGQEWPQRYEEKWNGQDYLFAMNGQTGNLVGDLPIDNGKLVRRFLLFLLPLLIVIAAAILFLFGGYTM